MIINNGGNYIRGMIGRQACITFRAAPGRYMSGIFE